VAGVGEHGSPARCAAAPAPPPRNPTGPAGRAARTSGGSARPRRSCRAPAAPTGSARSPPEPAPCAPLRPGSGRTPAWGRVLRRPGRGPVRRRRPESGRWLPTDRPGCRRLPGNRSGSSSRLLAVSGSALDRRYPPWSSTTWIGTRRPPAPRTTYDWSDCASNTCSSRSKVVSTTTLRRSASVASPRDHGSFRRRVGVSARGETSGTR
jgi:hypothetical protein